MIIRRSNGQRATADADACFEAVQRHHDPKPLPVLKAHAATQEKATANVGDIIYGARAIALYIFADDGNRARRRVFHLWAHYSGRKERAGFFKLKGALCLSKAQWRSFHGLD